MSIGVLLRNRLASGGVAALVSARVYPVLLPQTPTYPAVSYQRISNSGTNGSTALRESRWQVNCWAATYAGAVSLSEAVKAAMEEHTDVSQTPGIKYSRVVNEFDDYDPEAEIYRVILDVMLTTTGD